MATKDLLLKGGIVSRTFLECGMKEGIMQQMSVAHDVPLSNLLAVQLVNLIKACTCVAQNLPRTVWGEDDRAADVRQLATQLRDKLMQELLPRMPPASGGNNTLPVFTTASVVCAGTGAATDIAAI